MMINHIHEAIPHVRAVWSGEDQARLGVGSSSALDDVAPDVCRALAACDAAAAEQAGICPAEFWASVRERLIERAEEPEPAEEARPEASAS